MTNNSKAGQPAGAGVVIMPADVALQIAKQHAWAIDELLRKANTLPRGDALRHVLASTDLEAKITQAYALVAIASQLVDNVVYTGRSTE